MPENTTPDFSELKHHLTTCKNVLIVTHQFPDMDGMGACLALYEYLNAHDKKAVVWSSQELGKDFKFLRYAHHVQHKYPSDFKFDTLFVLDASHFNRVKNHQLITYDPDKVTVINIDHHPDNSLFGDINIVPHLSSVGEIMTLFFQAIKADITPTMATSLYAAMSFDTGRFGHNNVTSQTLRLASLLLESGADNFEITQHLDENKSPEDFQLVKYAIENLVVNEDLGYVYTHIPNIYAESHFKVIDFIRLLTGIDIFLVFQEIGTKKVKVNLRSKTKFDVSTFAQKFGGGGHKRASGILVEKPLEATKKEILDELVNDLTS